MGANDRTGYRSPVDAENDNPIERERQDKSDERLGACTPSGNDVYYGEVKHDGIAMRRIAGKRKSLRLTGRDYRLAGTYFVTLCTKEWKSHFGDVVDGEMRLSDVGRIVDEEWKKAAAIRDDVELDAYAIMPNHIHGLIVIKEGRPSGSPVHGPASGSIGAIVGQFKSAVTKRIPCANREGFDWQRGYYDRIVRNNGELNRIREYIKNNPANWKDDEENPNSTNVGASRWLARKETGS